MRQEPSRNGRGKTVQLEIRACVRSGSGLKEVKQLVDLPASLKDAVRIYGEKEVFKLFVDSLIIRLQAKLRNSAKKPNPKPRTWADAIEDAR